MTLAFGGLALQQVAFEGTLKLYLALLSELEALGGPRFGLHFGHTTPSKTEEPS